ncbi:MAG: helix-turn-helix domain-containing protein [Planctomycetota bacterium]
MIDADDLMNADQNVWALHQGTGPLPPRQRHVFPEPVGGLGLRLLGIGRTVIAARPDPPNPTWSTASFGLMLQRGRHGAFRSDRQNLCRMQAGDCFVLLPGIRHSYGPLPDQPWIEDHILLDGPVLRLLYRRGLFQAEQPIYRQLQPAAMIADFNACLQAAATGNASAAIPYVFTILHRLQQAQLAALERDALDHPLAHIADRLRRQPQQDWDMRALAAECGLSYHAFRQQFRTCTGHPPLRFLQQQRIRMACELLSQGRNVADTARAVGYRDPAYFARHFRALREVSPREYQLSITTWR